MENNPKDVESPTYGSIAPEPFQMESSDGHTYINMGNHNMYEYRLAGTHEDTEEAEYSSTYSELQLGYDKSKMKNRRWSVMEKLEKRHYCRIRSCGDCGRILNCKCLLATCMLAIFIVLAVAFAHVLFFATEVGSVRFDYIIVGAGPAGSLIANRLVSNGATVLLLESGNYTQYEVLGRDYVAGPMSRFDIPLMWPILSKFEEFQWGRTPEGQGVGNPLGGVVQARGVGGNGILGSMVYMRALPSDIEAWGLPAWSWERMLNLYTNLEHYTGHNDQAGVHGTCSGDRGDPSRYPPSQRHCDRLVTSPPQYVDEISSTFVDAARAAGFGQCADFNDHHKKRVGVGQLDFNIAGGVRDSSAGRFLAPILGYPGLVLEAEASVTQILMNADASLNATYPARSSEPPAYRAIGVEFKQNGELKRAFLKNAMIPEKLQAQIDGSSRGVILTAGALNTPRILMRSGVGPRADLAAAGIEAKVISEGVGRRLQDHPTVAVLAALDDDLAASLMSGYDLLSSLPGYVGAVEQSRSRGSHDGKYTVDTLGPVEADFGVLGSPGFSVGAFLYSTTATDHQEDAPDIQVTMYPFVPESFSHLLGAGGERRRKDVPGSVPTTYITVAVSLLRSESRTRVTLNHTTSATGDSSPSSLHAASLPRLQLENEGGVLLSDGDVSRLEWALEQARSILRSAPMNAHVVHEVAPEAHLRSSDNSLAEYVRSTAVAANNWCGSASMGTEEDPLSVLDENLRVRGVQDLRVADSSSLPKIPSGNIHATVLAVADYAASDIHTRKS